MKKNKILKPLRIDSETNNLIIKTLAVLNSNPSAPTITQAEFRRMALKFFSQSILSEGLTIQYGILKKTQ